MRKKTHQEFISQISNINPNLEILEEYKGCKNKIKTRCRICGNIWEPIPDSLLQGYGCPKCAVKKTHSLQRKSHEEFIKEISIINSDIEIKDKYINGIIKLKCFCKKCKNEWKSAPNKLLMGRGCPVCGRINGAKHKRKNTETFIDELRNINPDIKVCGEYITAHEKISCECLICNNIWSATPANLLKNKGCPICSLKKQGINRRTTDNEFKNRISNIHPNIIINDTYNTELEPISVTCNKCSHTWKAIPKNLLQGIGCPKCSISKGEKKIEAFLKSKGFEYITQKTFKDLFGLGNGSLSYDFYVPNVNALIEFQGLQHYSAIEYFGGEKSFIKQKEHDQRKSDYAVNNGFNLIIIPYWDYDNIEEILNQKLI